MSWTEVVSLHPNAPLRLGYYLLTAIMCCALAIPIGILWTKLLVIKTPPIEMAPIAEEPAKNPPSLSSPAETVTREAPPSAVLPREGVPAESAPSAGAPTAGIPTVTVPTATLPGEAPSALLLPRLEVFPISRPYRARQRVCRLSLPAESAPSAWGAGAGIAYPVAHNVLLDLAYKYLDLGEMRTGTTLAVEGVTAEVGATKADLQAHTVTLGVRVSF